MTTPVITDGKTIAEVLIEIAGLLVSQGTRCVVSACKHESSEATVCSYGNEAGHHCAVGFLLDDSDKELMEFEGSVGSLTFDYSQEKSLGRNHDFIMNNQEMLSNLQDIHDASSRGLSAIALNNLCNGCFNWTDWTEEEKESIRKAYEPWVALQPVD